MINVKVWVFCPYLERWQTRWTTSDNPIEAAAMAIEWAVREALRYEVPMDIIQWMRRLNKGL